jgi:hypothetical protein
MNTTHIELQLVQNNVQIIVQLTALSKELILCYNAPSRGLFCVLERSDSKISPAGLACYRATSVSFAKFSDSSNSLISVYRAIKCSMVRSSIGSYINEFR